MSIGEIRKALTPPVTAGLAWAALVVNSPSHPITAGEWLMGAGILATSLGVYAVTNAPPKAAPVPAPALPTVLWESPAAIAAQQAAVARQSGGTQVPLGEPIQSPE